MESPVDSSSLGHDSSRTFLSWGPQVCDLAPAGTSSQMWRNVYSEHMSPFVEVSPFCSKQNIVSKMLSEVGGPGEGVL